MKTAKTLILTLALCSICWGSAFAQRFDATAGTVFSQQGSPALSTSSAPAYAGITSQATVIHVNTGSVNMTGANLGSMEFTTGLQSSGDILAGTANFAPGGSILIRLRNPFTGPGATFTAVFTGTQVWRIRTDGSYRLQGAVLGTFDGVNFSTLHLTMTTAPGFNGNQSGIVTAVLQ